MNQDVAANGSLSDLLALLASSGHGGSDSLVLFVVVACALSLVAVHGSIAVRLVRMAVLVRDITTLYESGGGRDALLRDLDRTFAGSLLAASWSELMRRRRELEAHAPEDRAPIRLADLLVDRPLIPLGIRRRTMKIMPILLASLGFAATLGMLAGGLGAAALGTPIASIFGLALRGAFWGVTMGALAAVLAAVLEGTADAQAAQLSQLVERNYRSLTPIEAQLRGAEAQRLGFERVSSLLVQVAQDLRDSLDRGLGRIERSTANAAGLIGEEQRHVLELVITDLSSLLRRGVEDQVGALRTSLQNAADQQAMLGEQVISTIHQMNANAEGTTRVSGSLERAAQAVDEAAGTMVGSAGELKPLIVHLGEVAATLERAAARMDQAEALAGPTGGASGLLASIRDDIARIGAQFLDGATPLRHAAEPFQARNETHAEREVAQALQNFDQRAQALRERLDEIESPEARSTSNRTDGAEDAGVDEADSGEAPRTPEPSSARRGGDLASALARSGEQLKPPASELPQPPSAEFDDSANAADETDLAAVGRGGFSALLSRYKAPRFSIEELPPDLREFDANQVADRAMRRSPNDITEVLDPNASSMDEIQVEEHEARLDPDEPGLSAAEADRRRRLNRFLGSE